MRGYEIGGLGDDNTKIVIALSRKESHLIVKGLLMLVT